MYSTNNNSNSQKLCAVEQTKEQVGTKGEKKFIFLSGVFFARDKLFEIDIEFVNRKILIVCVRIICDYGMRLNESKKSGEQTKKYAQNFHRTVSTEQLVERGDHYAQLTILHQHSKQLHQFTFLAYNAMFFSFTITQFNGFFASFGWLRVCVCVLCANSSKPNFLRSLYSFVSSYPIQLILFIKSNCVCSVFVHLFLCSFFLQSHCM